jgi:SPP1 family predicted phage head-tail adaptor
MLTAGALRDRVTVQQKSTTADGQGGRSTTWATLATVFAQVLAMSARERLAQASIGALQAYTVIVRYRADITPAMRISWTPYRATSAKTLEIHSVQPHPDQPRTFLRLDCAEVI